MTGEYVLPVNKLVPPDGAAYQFNVDPAEATALTVTGPAPQRTPGVTDATIGLFTVIVTVFELLKTEPFSQVTLAKYDFVAVNTGVVNVLPVAPGIAPFTVSYHCMLSPVAPT